ncbi:uncharacterized protein VTP21DRAFT_2221 [Calcarisporiella thermophila]|uniref:uncharacterized protein n=1 Tax=Calcarisporiella thermophila TaxID=911321 RepID=UPI0037446381
MNLLRRDSNPQIAMFDISGPIAARQDESSPTPATRIRRAIPSRLGSSSATPKMTELTKLILHIFTKLRKRRRPPYSLVVSAESYTNDETVELVMQFREVLLNYRNFGWSLGSYRRRYGGTPASSRGHSPPTSPQREGVGGNGAIPGKQQDSEDDILARALEIFSELVELDARYRVANPRPTRPPYILQSLVLDLAMLLLEQDANNTTWLVDIGVSLIPAFGYFELGLCGKLLGIYCERILPKLVNLAAEAKSEEGSNTHFQKGQGDDYFSARPLTSDPSPSIQVYAPDASLASPQAPPRLYINTSPNALASRRSHSPSLIGRSISYSHATGSYNFELYSHYSLFTPLLHAMIQYTSRVIPDRNFLYQFYRNLQRIIECKPDVYLDLLEVIAYTSEKARYRAAWILFDVWERCSGAPVIGEPFPELGYVDEITALEEEAEKQQKFNGRRRDTKEERLKEHVHQYYPHIFIGPDWGNNTHQKGDRGRHFSQACMEQVCEECFKILDGYGMRCYDCHQNVHYHCYGLALHEGTGFVEMRTAGGVHKLIAPRYCHIFRSSKQIQITKVEGNPFRDVNGVQLSYVVRGHAFHLVNLFVLALCTVCKLPLWGIAHQGYRCTECHRFAHASCLLRNSSSQNSKIEPCPGAGGVMTEMDAMISLETLREDFAQYYRPVLEAAQMAEKLRYEELAVLYHVLRLQEAILWSGISAGSVMVLQSAVDPLVAFNSSEQSNMANEQQEIDIGLQRLVDFYERQLHTHRSSSVFLDDYWGAEGPVSSYILSTEGYIAHLAAMLKSQIPAEDLQSQELLQVQGHSPGSAGSAGNFPKVSPVPLETMYVSEMALWISKNLGFRTEMATHVLLQHMMTLGLFERVDGIPVLFPSDLIGPKYSDQVDDGQAINGECVFAIPYALDCSPATESLLSAIAGCLSDINITINECGMLLLIRRCWPDPFVSSYAYTRLMRAVLGWVCDEDERLLRIHREYAAGRQQGLPGVRKAFAATFERSRRAQNTQSIYGSSAITQGGVSMGGGAYIASRKELRDRYLAPWARALHDMEQAAFSDTMYQLLWELACEERQELWEGSLDTKIMTDEEKKAIEIERFETLLTYLIKLRSYKLTFTCFEDLLCRLLEAVDQTFEKRDRANLLLSTELRALHRIFAPRNAASRISGFHAIDHSSPMVNTAGSLDSNTVAESADLIHSIEKLINLGGADGCARGVHFLGLLHRSGMAIPEGVFMDIATRLSNHEAQLESYARLLEIVWAQVMYAMPIRWARSKLVSLVKCANEACFHQIVAVDRNGSSTKEQTEAAEMVVKASLMLVCHGYHSPLDIVESLGVLPPAAGNAATTKRLSMPGDNNLENIEENNVIVRYLLEYWRLASLDVRHALLKGFYMLTNYAAGILNHDEFITRCLPVLMPCVWQMITPAEDANAEYTVPLLMTLVRIDPRYLDACVHKVFENPNWEIRYAGLDNLLAIFNKMDEGFVEKWKDALHTLGPTFSYFVSCLWDPEEHVRVKARTCISTMQTLHLQSGFKCWEAYFAVAETRARAKLVKLMIQLNSLFPDWQVLNWKPLVETIAPTQPDEKGAPDKNKARLTTDTILNEYFSPETDSPSVASDGDTGTGERDESDSLAAQEAAEEENVRALLVTLALQMVANGVPISPVDFSRVKYSVVTAVGFTNCRGSFAAGSYQIGFGPLEFRPGDFSQHTMLAAFVFNVKRVLDSVASTTVATGRVVNEANAMVSMISGKEESLPQPQNQQQQYNIRKKLNTEDGPGMMFLDVVLKLFNSEVDLTKLDQLMLKGWLELILIIIYKYKVEDLHFEEDLLSCVRQVTDLLSKDISEDNRLLIISILNHFLNRAPNLAAKVLSRQITALGKLMTRLRDHPGDPVFVKSKQFLQKAFISYAKNGLFLLVFKNQAASDENTAEYDLFFVLGQAIVDKQLPNPVTEEPVYLRDEVVRDVIKRLLEQNMEKGVISIVLRNLSRYVELVHPKGYPDSLLSDYASFLMRLVKHSADWKRMEWDINPVLNMSAVLLANHPHSAKLLLPSMRSFLRHAILRCTLAPEAVVRLLVAYGIASETYAHLGKVNTFGEIIIEETKAYLRGKVKVFRDTVIVLLQLVLWDLYPEFRTWFQEHEQAALRLFNYNPDAGKHFQYFSNVATSLFEDCTSYLELPPATKQYSRKEFRIGMCTSQLVVIIGSFQPDWFTKLFTAPKMQDSRKTLRLLSWILLSLLRSDMEQLLYRAFDLQEPVLDFILFNLGQVLLDQAPAGGGDANYAHTPRGEMASLSFLLIKIWTVVFARVSTLQKLQEEEGGNSVRLSGIRVLQTRRLSAVAALAERRMWNSVWPVMQRLLLTIGEGIHSRALQDACIAVWEMFFELIEFLHCARSDAVMLYGHKWTSLLDSLMIDHPDRFDFDTRSKQVRRMFDDPPPALDDDVLVLRLFLELRECLRVQGELHGMGVVGGRLFGQH